MTNKEAIELLKELENEVYNEDRNGYKQYEALELAVKALEERPTGKWLHKEFDPFLKEYGQCSNCFQRERVGNFCRNCGTDMRGKKIQVPSCLTNTERYEELLERYKEE